jgi:ABC-type antimicrobial peptide transport system permease subunit
LGLSSFDTSRRTKEIAIRKVNGASAFGIVAMLFKEIFLLVVVASVIAIPIATILINLWLQNFAYRTCGSKILPTGLESISLFLL